jgi:hypothetical protein
MFLGNAAGAGYQSWYVTNYYNGGNFTVPISGDRLLAVASANTALSFQVQTGGPPLNIGPFGPEPCILIITQLQ